MKKIGNITKLRRGIARIDYDLLNNLVRIQFTDGSVTRYVYSAAGEKLRVTHLTAVPNITVAIGSTRELAPYEILSADSTDYLLGGSLGRKDGMTDKYLFDGGYAKATMVNPASYRFSLCYYNRDHLGNIREVVDSAGVVAQVTGFASARWLVLVHGEVKHRLQGEVKLSKRKLFGYSHCHVEIYT